MQLEEHLRVFSYKDLIRFAVFCSERVLPICNDGGAVECKPISLQQILNIIDTHKE